MTGCELGERAFDARAARGRAPDFFIVGHPKCGTTALYEMLRRHPQIYMPDLKETRFFARELHPRAPGDRAHPDTLAAYLALFDAAAPEQRVGEASPSYLRSRLAAARIAELRPDARIVAILREPASFIRSLHMELLRDRVETEQDLRAALALEDVRSQQREIERRPGLVYAEYVRYVEQLRRYAEVFPPQQIKVLIYDDFRRDNRSTLRAVLRFLGVDETLALDAVEANPTVRVRSLRVDELLRSLYLGRGPFAAVAKGALKMVTPRRARLQALAALRRRVVYGKPVAPDERVMRELRRRFRGEVLAVGEYLDRDLAGLWGYDRVD
jgi:Sulfotransferase family